MDDLVWILLSFSFIANLALAFHLFRRKRTVTLDAKDLLNDLTKNGRAIVEVKVLDPTGLFYRSFRG